MNRIAQQFTSLESLQRELVQQTGRTSQKAQSQQSTFQRVLQEKQQAADLSEVQFSKHANDRLKSRNMNLTQEQLVRLNAGVNQAREKNIEESLILVDNMSFIVNVPNNTVITALGGEDEQKVFTNIDGAVIS